MAGDRLTTMSRREAIGALSASALALTQTDNANAAVAGRLPTSPPSPPPDGPRMNLLEADRVMTELGIDALVLCSHMNIRHATGLSPVVTRMGFAPSEFAVLTRSPDPAITLVTGAFTYYYMLADRDVAEDVRVVVYGNADAEELQQQTQFKNQRVLPLTPVQRRRDDAFAATLNGSKTFANAEKALSETLASIGGEKGRIAVDCEAARQLLSTGTPEATIVGADDVLRRIRTVKSDLEILLMRESSAINIDAAHKSLEIVRDGASHRDVRLEFYRRAAAAGSHGVFMVIDHINDEHVDAEFREGQAFLIDCVSEYEGYHGDYGRTVFVGDAPRSMKTATRALANAWDVVRSELKPGMAFSDIRALGQRVLRQQNASYAVPFNPHSVGLLHSDHYGDGSSPPREDIVLRPGMILSVDCPIMETGIGGSAHLEDLVVITEDGNVPLHDTGHQTITV